jgi:hypothetical protein
VPKLIDPVCFSFTVKTISTVPSSGFGRGSGSGSGVSKKPSAAMLR